MKKIFFILPILLMSVWLSAQTPFTATYTFSGTTGHVESFTYNGTTYEGISMGTINKVGVTSSSSTNNFRASGWPLGATDGSDVFTGSVDTGKYIGFTINAVPGYKFTVSTIQFGIGRSATGTRQCQWRGSYDNYSSIINNYTTLNTNLTNSNGILTNPDANLSWTGNVLTLDSNYSNITTSCGFRLYMYNAEQTGGTAGLQGPITITGTFEPLGLTPSISVDPSSLTDFSYVAGSGPSSEKSFSLTGSNLTANLTVSISADAHFEISSTPSENFGNSLSYTPTDGSVSATVYVRMKAGLSPGTYSDETITCASEGATSRTVSCSGIVYKGEPANHVTNFTSSTVGVSYITLTWTDVSKYTPDGYLIKGSNVSFSDITAPVDGTPESNGTLKKNVTPGTQTCIFTGLTDNTTYYFKIYPYTNSGSAINYKTDGEVPQTSATTPEQLIFATDLFISEYIEGTSFNKAIEIFNGTGATIDLSQYKLCLYTNGSATVSNSMSLSGTLEHNDVYVLAHPSADPAILAVADAISNAVINFNGDDAVALITGETSNPTYIDIFGRIGEDPGTYWETDPLKTQDMTLVRKPNITHGVTVNPESGFPTLATEWDSYPVDTFTYLDYHIFSPDQQTAAAPTFDPPAGIYSSPINVTISSITPGVTIRYTTDGSTPSETVGTIYTTPVYIDATTTLKAVAYSEDYALSPVSQAIYLFPVNVSTIADLRAGTPGTYYKYTGTGVLTFQQAFRHQKFIQDNTGAILIDDNSGTITTTYNLYDGISNIIGTVAEYGGMMQLTPIADPGTAVSSGNVIIPQEISLNELATNFEQYESELVRVMNVSFDTADNTLTFTNGTLYPMNSGLMNFRTTFYDVDYIGMVVPTGLWNIIGIPNSRVAEGNLFTARFWADFSSAEQPPLPVVLTSFTATISNQNYINLTWTTQSEAGMLGYYVMRSTQNDLSTARVISPLIPATNTSQPKAYLYTDTEVTESGTYYYWLQCNNYDGIINTYGSVSIEYNPVGGNTAPSIPLVTELLPVYPNPFNPQLFIPFNLANKLEVKIIIYNTRGQIVKEIPVGEQNPGSYRIEWDGKDSKGQALPTGIYCIRMIAGKDYYQTKVVLMK